MISSLRPKRRLKGLLALMGMAKSSYEYAADALARPESAGRADARAAVVRAFGDSGGAYGYRRIAAQTGIGECDLCQDLGHGSSKNQAAIGIDSGLGSVLSKKAAIASAGTL